MTRPWTPLQPVIILGDLPMKAGTVTYALPTELREAGATGLLVFAWCALVGGNRVSGYWHVAAEVAPGVPNFFSLMGVGGADPTGTAFNSQAFWLPMPVDGALSVTLAVSAGDGFPSVANRGMVEVHGFLRDGG